MPEQREYYNAGRLPLAVETAKEWEGLPTLIKQAMLRNLIRQHGLSGNQVAAILGTDGRSFRRWLQDEDQEGWRAIPWMAWVALLNLTQDRRPPDDCTRYRVKCTLQTPSVERWVYVDGHTLVDAERRAREAVAGLYGAKAGEVQTSHTQSEEDAPQAVIGRVTSWDGSGQPLTWDDNPLILYR